MTDPASLTNTATVTAVVSYFPSGDVGASGEYGEFDNYVVTALP